MVPACRHKACSGYVAHHVEADEVVVEPQRVVDVGDVQMDVAHLCARGHGLVQSVGAVVGREVAEQLLEVDRIAAGSRLAVLVVGDERAVGEAHRAVLRRLCVDLDPIAVRVP